jgi:hypothetical protein
MVVIILLASQKSVMGIFTASRSLIILGWIHDGGHGGSGRADVHPPLGRRQLAARRNEGRQ